MSEKSLERVLYENRQARLADVGEQELPLPAEWEGSIEDLLRSLREGIAELFHAEYCSIEQTFSDYVIAAPEDKNGKLEYYQISYKVGKKQSIEFGSPVRVKKETNWAKAEQRQARAVEEQRQMWRMQFLAGMVTEPRPQLDLDKLTDEQRRMRKLAGLGDESRDPKILSETRKNLMELKTTGGHTVLLEDEEIEEGKVVKPMKIGGVATQGNVVNDNGRYYRTKLWSRECERKQETIKAGKMLGELDHPPDGKSRLSGTAVKYTDLAMEGDLMEFEGEVLETPAGETLKALLRGGVGIDVSTRGYGSTEKQSIDGKEVEDVQDDFELVAIDLVSGHSNLSAEIQYYKEGS